MSVFTQTVPPPSQQGEYKLLPSGPTPAVLVAIVDLGTHPTKRKNKDGAEKIVDIRSVYLAWELVDHPEAGLGINHVIGEAYTLSFHELAKLRQTIEKWRGRAYKEGENIDLLALLGRKCMVDIKHSPSKKDPKKVYHNLAGISDLLKVGGQYIQIKPSKCLEQSGGKGYAFEIGGARCALNLPIWLPKKVFGNDIAGLIQTSKEWTGQAVTPAANGTTLPAEGGEGEDEIPF